MTEAGLDIECADGATRRCHPVIAGIMADYEEQALITGIKKGQQCPICRVPPDKRENLLGKWKFRTHTYTQERIRRQAKDGTKPKHPMFVHPLDNFAWRHSFVNVHTVMMVDILHQLLKGIVMRLVEWVVALIAEQIKEDRRRYRRPRNSKKTIAGAKASIQLDQRFRQVENFTGLKRFQSFSSVQQWAGPEQKAMVRQLLPVVAPLLEASHPAALHCARAVLDFVMLSTYASHDDTTLGYLEHALYRIDKLKSVFRNSRPRAAQPAALPDDSNDNANDRQENQEDEDRRHFNIPKLHALSHYQHFIRQYGSAQGFDTCHSEAAHKYLIKRYFPRTNKNIGFESQILDHNVRALKMLAMEDIMVYSTTHTSSTAEQQIEAQIAKMTRDPISTSLPLPTEDSVAIEALHLPGKEWRRAYSIANDERFGAPDFLTALAVFLREKRKNLDKTNDAMEYSDSRENDSRWAGDFFVGIHNSMTTYVRSGRDGGMDGSNIGQLVEQHIRCQPNWRNLGVSRRDTIWIQEIEPDPGYQENGSAKGSGRSIGRLILLFTVVDHERRDDQNKYRRYSGVFLERFKWKNQGVPLQSHGMLEVEVQPASKSLHPRKLGGRRAYDISVVIRSAHLVPKDTELTTFYVNNFIDWDQYNTIYEEDFISSGIRTADSLARSLDG